MRSLGTPHSLQSGSAPRPAQAASFASRCNHVCRAVTAPSRPTASAVSSASKGGSELATVLALVQFAVANKITFSGCRPDIKNGIRGVFATTDCNAGETLVAVPLQTSISVQPGERCPFPEFVPQDVWAGLPWYAQLAVKLLHERALGPASRFADYLPALPSRVDLPAEWPAEAVRALQYPYLQEQITEEQQEWARLYNTLKPHLARRNLSRDDLTWALACVRSRTFAGPHFPTPPRLRLAAGAAAAVAVAAAQAALGLGGGAEGVAAVAAAVLPALLAGVGLPAAWQAAEARRAQSGEPGTVLYSVCPFIDMFNHDSRAQSECVFAPWSSEFRVVAGESCRRGGQLLINYGSQSNDALLQRYGFVQLEGNPHDRYVLQNVVEALAAALERGDGGGGLPAATREEVRAAARGLNAPAGSLDQVPLTASGGIPPATAQALGSLLAAVTAGVGGKATVEAALAAACAAELAAAATTLADDVAALAGLAAWEAWEAGAEERAGEAEARRVAAVEADAAAAASTVAAARAVAVAAAEAYADAGPGAMDARDSSREGGAVGAVTAEAMAVAQPEAEAEAGVGAAPEPEPELVLPPAELAVLGGEAERLRTVLLFRIAKKRVLAGLCRTA